MSNEVIRRSKRVRDLRRLQNDRPADEPDGPRRKKAPKLDDSVVQENRSLIETSLSMGALYRGCMGAWHPDKQRAWDRTQALFTDTVDRCQAKVAFAGLCQILASHELAEHYQVDRKQVSDKAFAKFLDTLDLAGFKYWVGSKDIGHGMFDGGCSTHDGKNDEFRVWKSQWCIHFESTASKKA